MDCPKAQGMMGAYLDGVLPEIQAEELEAHVAVCRPCSSELEKTRSLVDQLNWAAAKQQGVTAPKRLWSQIEQQLERDGRQSKVIWLIRLFKKPLAAAASLAILVGTGVFFAIWLSAGTGTAQAFTVDYSILLDDLAVDVDAAVMRFFDHYNAVPIDAESAQAAAGGLNFAIPPELPGGYHIEQAYRLKFGDSPGIAARYRRDQEPLVVFFHPPVEQAKLGIHRESDCQVAGRDGHQVEVGPWRLIHFTDPTTCHCLLSKLDNESDVFAVLAGIAPEFSKNNNMHKNHAEKKHEESIPDM